MQKIPYSMGKFAGTCCRSQVGEFERHGLQFGVSPEDYFKKVTNFSARGKTLTHIQVFF